MSTVDGGTGRALTEAEQPTAPVGERPVGERPAGRLQRLRRRTLTVSVEGALLRAVGFSGSRVVAWAAIDLDDPAGASLPPALAAFTRGRSRRLTDLPFYASLVRYLEKPAARRRFLDRVVELEVGNTIPFALEEVDLRWKVVKDGRGPEVMAWAVPRWEVDAYIRLVGLVGVRPSASYAKALALSAAVGRSNAAIAHLTSSEAELVLVRDGVPRQVHRVELPPADATAYAGALAQAIEELCASSGQDAPYEPTVVLTGQVPADAGHVQALADTFGERLRGPIPSIEAPDGFPALEYATNVGLMLADRDRPRLPWRASPAQQVIMDLLPPRHRRLQLPARAIGIALLFGALGAGAVAATSFVQQAESWADRQEASLAGIVRNVRIDNVAAARDKNIRLKLDGLAAQVQALDDEVRTSREGVALVVERARALTGEPAVEVSDVSLAGGEVRVSGSAPSYRAVVAFADGLRATGLFEQLRTTSAAGTSREAGEAAGSGAGGIAFSMIGSYSSGADPDRDEAS